MILSKLDLRAGKSIAACVELPNRQYLAELFNRDCKNGTPARNSAASAIVGTPLVLVH